MRIPGAGSHPILMVLPEPLLSAPGMLQQRAIDCTWHYLHQAEGFFRRSFRLSEIRFDVRGKTAGYFKQLANGNSLINFNFSLLQTNGESFISRTVPHEVAHLVAYQVHGSAIRPHGREWKAVMQLFKADASRCHDYDMSNVVTRQYRRFEYHCQCQAHFLTSIRHNRVLSGQDYLCRKCHQPLTPRCFD